MNNNRFTTDGLNIQGNNPKGYLYLLEEKGGVNALCSLINGLNDKSKRLEKENDELKSIVRYFYDSIDGFMEDYSDEAIGEFTQTLNDNGINLSKINIKKVMWND